MNHIYPPGYCADATNFANAGIQSSAPVSSGYAANGIHPIVALNTETPPTREPPMLLMTASDPEETGGPGCAVAGISRERMGACFKYTWVREWKYPTTEELLYVQRRLLDFLIEYGLRQADMCDALGLVTTYMSLFLKDVHSSNLGSRRRAEMYCVLNEFFQLVDEEAFDMEAIFRVRARRRHSDRCFRLPEESMLPQLPPDDPLDITLDRAINQFPGISRRGGGRLMKFSSVNDWRHPNARECTELRDNLLVLLNHAMVKPVDLADGLGLVAPYLVHFLADPFHPLVGRKRRGELFSVCSTYLRQIESGEAEIAHLQILHQLRKASENTVRNSRAPAPVYKRGPAQISTNASDSKVQAIAGGATVLGKREGELKPHITSPLGSGVLHPPEIIPFGTHNGLQGENFNKSGTDEGEPQPSGLQMLHVPGLKVGGKPPQPQPLAEEGLTDQEFAHLIQHGVPNSVPVDVAFHQHYGKWLQPVSMGGGDPRAIPGLTADWRGSDLLLYQHPEGRIVPPPEEWPRPSDGVALQQEMPPMHATLKMNQDEVNATDGIDTNDDPSKGPNGRSGMAEVWQWNKLAQGLTTGPDQSGMNVTDALPTLVSMPHWNPVTGSQEYHLYRYLFNRWREVISHACSLYQSQARKVHAADLPPAKIEENAMPGTPGADLSYVANAATPDMTPPDLPGIKQEEVSLADLLHMNWNANQITSTFLSYHLWMDSPAMEENVFKSWLDLDQVLFKPCKAKLITGDDDKFESDTTAAAPSDSEDDLQSILRSPLDLSSLDVIVDSPCSTPDAPRVPLCLVVSAEAYRRHPKCPGDRPWEGVGQPTDPQPSGQAPERTGLFGPETAAFIEDLADASRGGEACSGRQGVHQTLIESCLLPHHEWFTVSLDDTLTEIELISEARVLRELGMAAKLQEVAAWRIRRQALSLQRLFRCHRIARNALHIMAKSQRVATHRMYFGVGEDNHIPSLESNELINAISSIPVIIDVIVEDEQLRIKDFAEWNMEQDSYNAFAQNLVSNIMTHGKGSTRRNDLFNVGGTSLLALMDAHRGVPVDKPNYKVEATATSNPLPESIRGALDVGVRRGMLVAVADYCREVHRIWKEFMLLDTRKAGESYPDQNEMTEGPSEVSARDEILILTVPALDFQEFLRHNDPHDMIENLPYLMYQAVKVNQFIGSVDIPQAVESVIYGLLDAQGPEDDSKQVSARDDRGQTLLHTYLSGGVVVCPWDPFSSLRLRQSDIQRAHAFQAQTQDRAQTAKSGPIASSPRGPHEKRSPEPEVPAGPRRSTRVASKTMDSVTLRERLGLSSSESSSDDRPARRRKPKKKRDSEDEEEWGEESADDSDDDDSEVDEENASVASEPSE